MNDQEFARLHAKLRNAPPFDWEDDVEMLLAELDRYHKELSFCQSQHAIMSDAIMRIQNIAERTPHSINEQIVQRNMIIQYARGAQVKIQGEK